jgi:hypothetical protein
MATASMPTRPSEKASAMYQAFGGFGISAGHAMSLVICRNFSRASSGEG